ncbi:MAG: rRNA pseudouridine synthase, partial [Bacteroidia bacterium]|nr:rRNA pseudouridine synthase [Bacteroidia bacterium]
GGYNNNSGGGYENRNYNSGGGGYNNNRGGGYENRNYNSGGGYDNNRGGGNYENRNYNSGGGYNNRGGYENRNNEGGGYNNNRGGYENSNNEGGGYNNNRGGYENRNNEGGGYNNNRGGGGYNNNRGGGGGYNNNRGGGGGYNNNRGGGSRLVKASQLQKKTPVNYGFEEEIIPDVMINESTEMRLNKYIAQCGVCGRRDADDLIKEGKVQVNGITVTQMGIKIHPNEDVITFNGQSLSRQKKIYILYNKPKPMAANNNREDANKKTVLDAIEEATSERVYPVGRLDKDTTGLIILTNDGDLTEKLTHPSNDIKKFYHVILSRPIAQEEIDRLVSGVELEDGLANADSITYVEGRGKEEVLVEIHIGRNRIVRRMFELMGIKVKMLDRVKIAFLTKKGITRGNWRYLNEKEIAYLKMLPSHNSETVLHDNNSVDADDTMDAEA